MPHKYLNLSNNNPNPNNNNNNSKLNKQTFRNFSQIEFQLRFTLNLAIVAIILFTIYDYAFYVNFNAFQDFPSLHLTSLILSLSLDSLVVFSWLNL